MIPEKHQESVSKSVSKYLLVSNEDNFWVID